MPRRLHRPVVVAMVALAISSALPMSAVANTLPSANPIKDCLARMVEPRLAVQFLIDESRSLQSSDPLGRRVEAITSSIASLAFNFADIDESSENRITIDVRLVGFSKQFQDHGMGWFSLGDGDNQMIYSEVEKFRNRNTGSVTNYKVGLEGAEESFVAYDRDRGGDAACKALVWLTDGSLDLDNSSANQGPEEKQKRELCGSEGVVDRLRSQQVFVIGLGLNANSAKRQDFTLMSQMLEGGCGERQPYGTFSEVGSADDLIREIFRNLISGDPNTLVPCRGEETDPNCREVRFSVRPPLSRINVLVGLTNEIDSALVISPKGAEVAFADGGKAMTIRAGRVTSQPSFDLSTILRLEVGGETGEWRLQFRGPGAKDALVMSVFFSDVVVEIEDLPLRIDRRDPEPVLVSLGDMGLDGLEGVDDPAEIADFDSPVTVEAELALGSVLARGSTEESPGSPGRFSVEFDADQLADVPSNGTLTLRPVAVLNGQTINFTPRVEQVVLVLGDGFPSIEAVSATNIDDDGLSTVSITFGGPEEGAGTALVLSDKFEALELPAGRDVNQVRILPSRAEATAIESGETQVVAFTVDPQFKANGRFKGQVQVELRNSFGDVETQTVAFDFNMTKPFDTGVFLWVLLVMLTSFLLVQGTILFLAIDRFSRISKVPTGTYFVQFIARVPKDGLIELLHPSSWLEVFTVSSNPVPRNVSGKRRHSFGDFVVYGTRGSGLRWLVAGGESSIAVSRAGHVVVGSRSDASTADGRGRVSPQLCGEWAASMGQSAALELKERLSESDGVAAGFEDDLPEGLKEILEQPTIDVDFVCFVADFDGSQSDALVDELILRLSGERIQEKFAQSAPAPLTAGPDGPLTEPSPDPVEGRTRSIEEEYG